MKRQAAGATRGRIHPGIQKQDPGTKQVAVVWQHPEHPESGRQAANQTQQSRNPGNPGRQQAGGRTAGSRAGTQNLQNETQVVAGVQVQKPPGRQVNGRQAVTAGNAGRQAGDASRRQAGRCSRQKTGGSAVAGI